MDLIKDYIEHNYFGKLLGMDFSILSPGKIEYRMTVVKQHLATPNSAHGGAISSLIDAALGVAGLSLVHLDHKVVSTIEFKVNFISPAFLNDELLAKAEVIQSGKRILVIGCDVICNNRSNKLIARALGTFNTYDATKAGYIAT